MASLSVSIALDNEALQDGEGNVDREMTAKLLHQIARRIVQGDSSGRAVDANGNTVGSFALEDDA